MPRFRVQLENIKDTDTTFSVIVEAEDPKLALAYATRTANNNETGTRYNAYHVAVTDEMITMNSVTVKYLLTKRWPHQIDTDNLLEVDGKWFPVEKVSGWIKPEKGSDDDTLWINVTVDGHLFLLYQDCMVPVKIPGYQV